MSTILLRDILINARQESYRMRHFYLGVEHLFIALCEIQGGLAVSLLEDHGLKTDYVIDAVRRRVGKGSHHRLWAGLPNTPRADIVLGIANDLALEQGHEEIGERDLLMAIFEEHDSLPMRVLARLGLPIDAMASAAAERTFDSGLVRAYVQIEFSPEAQTSAGVSDAALFVLRRVFHGYGKIRIERQLGGGYSGAFLVVVTPVHSDGRADAAVVVKIDQADEILNEALRYEQHIKATLPPLTARLEDKPTAPETSELAGLKYTFVATDGGQPRDLRELAHTWSGEKLGQWLQEGLFSTFGKTWWLQRRPYRFQVWMEYDWLLPPLLTLEWMDLEEPPAEAVVLREPSKRTRLIELEYGDVVVIENFTIQRISPATQTIRLTVGRGTEAAKRAFPVDVTGVDFGQTMFFRGEVVERLTGRLFKTRQESLFAAVNLLRPDFNPQDRYVPALPGSADKLPNPLLEYDDLLDLHINGSVSKIHGDLHLGNILVGPGETAFLIDFAHARDGHTLADWALLEISLLCEVIHPLTLDESWGSARIVGTWLQALDRGEPLPAPVQNTGVIDTLRAVRSIVSQCLAQSDQFEEYRIALIFNALRALGWETLSLGARRLMFVVAAVEINELRRRPAGAGSAETQPDTNFTDSLE